MVTVHVLRPFYDFKFRDKNGKSIQRQAGTTFEATEERAAHIAAALPGYVSIERNDKPQEKAHETNLAKLTVAALRKLCSERGIEVPSKAKKADLVALLEE